MRTKINEYAKENPKESLRMIANNLGISKSVVHKYIQDINKEKSNKNGHP